MSTQPPLAVCVSSWFVHRSWCSVFIPALQLNKWGPIRCFSPWVLLSAFNMPHTFYHCRKPSNVSVNFWKWLYSNSDVKVFRKRKYIFESVYWTPISDSQLSFLFNNIFLAFLLLLARSHIIRSECHCFSSFYRRFLMLRHLFVSWRGIRICQAYSWLCPLQQFEY